MTIHTQQTQSPCKTLLYCAYGLTISSDRVLPDLLPGAGEPDLFIRAGVVPEDLTAPHFVGELIQTSRTDVVLKLKQQTGAAFWIRNGNEILVDTADDAEDDRVSVAISGLCFTAILFQRQYFVLHGNAVLTSAATIVICGHRKAGKSTTTAALCRRGSALIADDIAAIDTTLGIPVVKPGVPRLKLWHDTLNHFDESCDNLLRVLPDLDKYIVPFHDSFYQHESPLSTIYVLKCAEINQPTLRHLSGIEKLHTLCAEIRSFLPEQLPSGKGWLLQQAVSLANKVNVVVVQRPVEGITIDTVASLILQDTHNNTSGKMAASR